jgi:hypothetical protein
VAVAQSHCLELSGTLSKFDLVTIYQTIVNSSQTGELRICDEKSDLICALFFEKGHPRCGQFQHLTGEEAVWQMFLRNTPTYTFSFSAGDRAVSAWVQSEPIPRAQGDLLITALRGRDEFYQLKERLPNEDTVLFRQKSRLLWPASAPAELKPVAEEIWSLTDEEPVTLAALFRRCTFCELKIYQAVDELVQSKHFQWPCRELAKEVA